jgi:ketosteroid isomerase-like protein
MSPQNTIDELIEHINKNDLDGIISLYEPGAVFAVKPGEVVKGTKAIREIFSQMLKAGVSVAIEKSAGIETDDVATCINRVKVKGGGFGSEPLLSFDVLRKQPNGKWLFLIDNGSGTGFLK